MSGRPDRLVEANQWAEKADHDLRNAEHTLLIEDDCPFDTVCFHAQQCVEKYLKAALIWRSVRLRRPRLDSAFFTKEACCGLK